MSMDIGCRNTVSPNAYFLYEISVDMENCNWRHICGSDMVFRVYVYSYEFPGERFE